MRLVNFLETYNDFNFDLPSSSTSNADVAGIIGGVLAALGVMLIFILALVIVMIIAKWILFKKMGIDGWKSLIPTVETYLQMEATGVDQRWLLILTFGGLVCIVPLIGFLVYMIAIIYFWILYNVSLAKSFGKSTGFAVGLMFLSPIFLCILAFGHSQYVGKVPMNDVIFKK